MVNQYVTERLCLPALLGQHYQKEGQEAHQKHTAHQQLRESYAKIQVLRSKTGVIAHCNDIAKYYEKIAKEYEALAKLHTTT